MGLPRAWRFGSIPRSGRGAGYHIGNATRPTSDMTAFYRRLLELNARELVHANYGVDQGRVVLSRAL